jgi:hypothetical protein
MRWAAKRSVEHPELLGSHLDQYKKLHSMDNGELASYLECASDALIKVSLCRRPIGSNFRADVELIAAHCEVNPLRLAQLVREVESIWAMREFRSSSIRVDDSSGMLAAARDHSQQPVNRGRPKKPRQKS